MSEQIGVMFADYRAETAGTGLNMSRIEIDAISSQRRTLVAGPDGSLMLNGRETPAQDHHTFAMAIPAPGKASSASMATVIDLEVQRILHEGYEMARTLLKDHSDELTKLADALMEREQLDRKQFESLLQG